MNFGPCRRIPDEIVLVPMNPAGAEARAKMSCYVMSGMRAPATHCEHERRSRFGHFRATRCAPTAGAAHPATHTTHIVTRFVGTRGPLLPYYHPRRDEVRADMTRGRSTIPDGPRCRCKICAAPSTNCGPGSQEKQSGLSTRLHRRAGRAWAFAGASAMRSW